MTSFLTWLRTWNKYTNVVFHYRPHLLPQMFRYQAAITKHALRYPRDAWVSYDAACRRLLANNPTLSWDDVILDNDLIESHLRSSHVARVTERPASGPCFSCGQVGHLSRSCPVSARTSSARTPNFRAPQRQSGPCFQYNDVGKCSTPGCRWAHRCSQCHGNHPRSACNKPT